MKKKTKESNNEEDLSKSQKSKLNNKNEDVGNSSTNKSSNTSDKDPPKKRGRKRKYKRYFDEPEEKAVREYLAETDPNKRDKIYTEKLAFPLFKMAESIINRYQLWSYELSLQDLIDAALSYLNTKMDKFNPEAGTKAYSYYGTVIKNYALSNRQSEQKKMAQNDSYELNRESIISNEKLSYRIDEDDSLMTEYFYEFIDEMKALLDENDETELFKDTEVKLIKNLIYLMENWESVFDEGGKKFNKNQYLEYMRNMTSYTTKEIRDNKKLLKKIFYQKKKKKIDKDYYILLKNMPESSEPSSRKSK